MKDKLTCTGVWLKKHMLNLCIDIMNKAELKELVVTSYTSMQLAKTTV